MNQTDKIETIYLPISEQLNRVEKIIDGSIGSSAVSLIREVGKYIISGGGKRFRPAIAILSAKICGYSRENIYQIGAAIEMIHTASIIHDDVLDGADVRRGGSSANVKWGNHISILVGDYFLSVATNILTKYGNRDVISVISDAATKTTEGEVLEVVNSNDLSMDEGSYLQIIKNKTAWLIAASCKAGAVLAEATPRLADALENYGLNLGMAFQIVDDILDYTNEEEIFGKGKGIDLREGKLTLPLIYALKRCHSDEKEIIKESLLAPTHSEEHFKSVVDILKRYECIYDTRETARKYVKEAVDCLAPFRPSLEKESLMKFAEYVLNRKM